MRRSTLLALSLLVCAIALLFRNAQPANAQSAPAPRASASTPGGPVTKEEVESFMQHTFGWNPELKWQVAGIGPSEAAGITEVNLNVNTPQGQQALVLFVTPDRRFAISGDMVPFGADPYASVRTLLSQRVNGPAKGPKDAPLTIVEFSDLQCPHCKAAQPVIDKLLGENPNARFVFQHFPIASLHDWAMKAASYSVCVEEQNPQAFWKFAQSVYDAQETINAGNADAKLTELATAAGVNGQTAATCSASPQTKARVDQSIELGKQVGVTGTPTLFLNGRKIQNVSGTPYEVLTAIAKYQAGTGK